MSPQRIPPAAKLVPGVLIVAAVAWWGLSSVGTGQPVAAQSPASAKSAAGRVEGGGDILSLGTSATGTIAALLVKAGDNVQPGQHLVRVECTNVERELEARRSDLAAGCSFLHAPFRGITPRARFSDVFFAGTSLEQGKFSMHFIEQRSGHSCIPLGLINLDPSHGEALVQLLGSPQRLFSLLQSCVGEIDVCDPDADFLGTGTVQGPQIKRLGCGEVRPASVKLAFHVATFDPHKVLAWLNIVTRFDQQRGNCAGRRGTKRPNVATTLDAPGRGLRAGWRLGGHRLAGANTAQSPPCDGGDNEHTG